MEKNCTIPYKDDEKLLTFAAALSSPLRVNIMRELSGNSMSVKELAFKLNIPLSTASANIKILEDAGLIRTNYQAGKHGSMKLCSICFERFIVELAKEAGDDQLSHYTVDMPIGGYFDLDIVPTCGIADEFSYIGKDDDTRTFYSAKRFQAQLIWFRAGFLEYRFPLEADRNAIRKIQFSLECCSEAPGYRNEFPSDITFWVNGTEVCQWTSPGDFGGVRGQYSPEWWPINSTQFGIMKKLSVTERGCYLDSSYVNPAGLQALKIGEKDFISFKIGVKSTAKNIGGINIFGEKFGNYAQNILMDVDYVSTK